MAWPCLENDRRILNAWEGNFSSLERLSNIGLVVASVGSRRAFFIMLRICRAVLRSEELA